MPRPMEPIISDRDPLFLHDYSLKLDSMVDLTKFKPSSQPKPEQQSNRVKANISTFDWELTLETCIKSIVSIKTCRTRGLDTEVPGSFTATGFVVDPERGIILSNRHVVSVSPVTALAVFCNYEEIELKPIYRDPVHDFGFFQYDTTKIRFLDIPGIELYPKGAKIGQDIRVVGNDAGEKLSILSGTLARMDREAPNYGIGEYNDFNTFYYQAASSTSSGSSGSPVLDIQGRAIALNAGGAQTSSSSYYLPLDRAQRALKLIQKGKNIPRGTLQATFEYQSYDALLQLGLGHHIEKRLRSQLNSSSDSVNEGLLVVQSVLPDGPAYGQLEPGDILLTCNGSLLPGLFVDLEGHIDNAIEKGSSVEVVVSRAGAIKELSLTVQDLHSITPHRYVEFGGGILNDLSYQMARSYGLSLKDAGVYVGASGFILGTALALRKSVIVGINNKQVKSLDDFISIVSDIKQGSRVPIRYYSLSRAMKMKVMVLHMDWRWHKFQLATRNDKTGVWDYKLIEKPLNKENNTLVENSSVHTIKTDPEENPLEALKKSIVSVDCYPPFVVDGLKNSHSYGAGVVVSMHPPLVLCDRDTVPIGISVISLTFDNSVTVSADLLFLHPYYNYAVLKFDPLPLIEAGIELHVAELDGSNDLSIGDSINYIGLSGRNEVNTKKTTIISLAPVRTTEALPPRWRATNVESYKVSDGTLASQGGLFADNNGKVKAIWMSFSTDNERREQTSILGGLPTRLIVPIIDKIKDNLPTVVRGLDVEFWTMQISNARLLGVSDTWIQKLKKIAKGKSQPSIIYVLGITDLSSLSGKMLRPGDIVLSVNDHAVTSISDFGQFDQEKELNLTIVRDGEEQKLVVPTTEYDGTETSEVVGWQGMLIQNSYTAAKEQVQNFVPEGVYVSCCLFGSPAQASLKPGMWITEIDQVPVRTLDELLNVVNSDSVKQRHKDKLIAQQQGNVENICKNQQSDATALLTQPTAAELDEMQNFQDESHIQVKFVTRDNVTHVKAMRMDNHYWPTWHIVKDDTSALGWDLTFMS